MIKDLSQISDFKKDHCGNGREKRAYTQQRVKPVFGRYTLKTPTITAQLCFT